MSMAKKNDGLIDTNPSKGLCGTRRLATKFLSGIVSDCGNDQLLATVTCCDMLIDQYMETEHAELFRPSYVVEVVLMVPQCDEDALVRPEIFKWIKIGAAGSNIPAGPQLR